MQACCHDPQNALVEEGAMPCAAARCCDPQNAQEEGVIRCHMQAAVMIHRMLWWKKVVLSLRCHASSLLL
jgi:hypothetical protein